VIQLNKQMMYIMVVVLVAIIVIAGVAVYLLYYNGDGGTTNPTPTPTPMPNGVADATTLTLSANVTSQGQTTEYMWAGKDLQAVLTIRVDFVTYAYILDAGEQTSWMSMDSGTTWAASTFAADWGTTEAPGFGNQWSEYVDELDNWSGSGEYTYENAAGETITLFNIVVNPTIPDSTFAVS